LEDRRNIGEISCNSGDGTDQRVQSMMFMMMMMMMMMICILTYCLCCDKCTFIRNAMPLDFEASGFVMLLSLLTKAVVLVNLYPLIRVA
jgi:hypothetical protein